MRVLSSGSFQGLSTSMPLGGQTPSNNAVRACWAISAGNRLELKNAQNQATKNITSER